MRCPFCDYRGPRPEMHAHLTDSHTDAVKTWENQTGKRFYELECPLCGDTYRKEVKPRLRDPSFLEEYGREIRIVAFDMFLYHLQGEHEHEESDA